MRQKKEKKPKLPKGVTEEFVSSVDSSSTEDLQSMIVRMQKDLDDVSIFLKTNVEIARLKEELTEIESPAKETRTVLNNRTKMVIEALKSRGAL